MSEMTNEEYAEAVMNTLLRMDKDKAKLMINDFFNKIENENNLLKGKINSLEKENEWISVKDRLPSYEECLCVFWEVKNNDIENGIPYVNSIDFNEEKNKSFITGYTVQGESFIRKITHWKPLPPKPH